MGAPSPQPGWYADPNRAGQQRYFDGQQWTEHAAPLVVREPTAVVEGPNHVLHFLLTLLTFWMCGGWAWIWLVIALADKKRIRYVS
jgi:hypothetical protein